MPIAQLTPIAGAISAHAQVYRQKVLRFRMLNIVKNTRQRNDCHNVW